MELGLGLLTILGLLVCLEISLRLGFGFGNPLLYLADEQIGYLLAPNQQVKRFGNQIEINQYSMRSPEITEARSPTTIRVLLLGDSVANGGWWTDQTETVSELLRQQLQTQRQQAHPLETIEVLNASANSWGPRNELAYLQRFGTFQSQVVVLILNTDDLFATAPTSLAVGRDLNYPERKPALALIEVMTRYLLPKKPVPGLAEIQAESGDRVGFNLEAIQSIQTIVHQAGGLLLLTMTPLLRELHSGPREYELKARQRLLQATQSQQIPYVDFLPIFAAVASAQALYRDHIHLSPQGNRLVSDTLSALVEQQIPHKNP